jgi:uncharacterized protein YaeQ
MALGATIFKADLQISDMERNYYADHSLTLARHPSETDERMMVRLLAFALHADERLSFTKGICAEEEPDLWLKSYTDEIEQWIDVGQPEERRLRKACGRAQRVTLYLYGGRGADLWWQKNAEKLARLDNLQVVEFPDQACKEMTGLVKRNMQLQCTVQDGEIWLSDGEITCSVTPLVRKAAG